LRILAEIAMVNYVVLINAVAGYPYLSLLETMIAESPPPNLKFAGGVQPLLRWKGYGPTVNRLMTIPKQGGKNGICRAI
jgi:hypothetical protein